MNDFDTIVKLARSAAGNSHICGIAADGRKVYHTMSDQGTYLRYWFTLNPDSICHQVHTGGLGLHVDHFDIRNCDDLLISQAVAHWSGHRPAVLS